MSDIVLPIELIDCSPAINNKRNEYMSIAEFTNDQITSKHRPNIDDIDMLLLDKKYPKANRIILSLTTLVCALLFLSIYFQPFIALTTVFSLVVPIIGGIITTILILLTLYHSVADPLKSYALRSHDLSYFSGLIFKKMVTQPITRIQHIELKQGPIERRIGLATLQVFSAGGAMHTFEIPGLSLTTAQHIRQYILQHKDSVQYG
ncbi:MAG: membrane protein YdbS with pleckstrin-like domain [Alteromonadaceae bacterium]|jgi:membrane protein YdbS with pleckstrin-like domain